MEGYGPMLFAGFASFLLSCLSAYYLFTSFQKKYYLYLPAGGFILIGTALLIYSQIVGGWDGIGWVFISSFVMAGAVAALLIIAIARLFMDYFHSSGGGEQS
ncbi:YesK family protein [Alteribacillus sp. HJP-4]|uniref:YesK family protein n=1 Tax=Alteribacillus sp. HJP-4 TaxID=2775394 RepID=UPI0035CCFC42